MIRQKRGKRLVATLTDGPFIKSNMELVWFNGKRASTFLVIRKESLKMTKH